LLLSFDSAFSTAPVLSRLAAPVIIFGAPYYPAGTEGK